MDIQRGKKAQYSLPKCGLIMGAPKVGKSTFIAQDEKTLILDLEPVSDESPEEGAYFGIDIAGGYVHIKNLDELYDALRWYFSDENDEFNTLAIDQIRALTTIFSNMICDVNGANTIVDIGYGKGIAALKKEIEDFIKNLIKKSTTSKRTILIAHSTDKDGEVRLDVDGKNENLIFSMVDYIGYLFRSGPELHINFTQGSGTEYGCRNKHLALYKGKADLQILKDVASGKAQQN